MQRIFFLLVAVIGLLASCKQVNLAEGAESPVGKWALTEVFISPGAGGSWNEVESEAEIEFMSNGRFKANADMCSLALNPDESTRGKWDAEQLDPTNGSCGDNDSWKLPYTLDETGDLLIYYPCIEPCIHKYVRID